MKYQVYQTKNCRGAKTNIRIYSSADINIAHRRVSKVMERIKMVGRHTTSTYYGCSKTSYSDRYGALVNYNRENCKAKFEVREVI